MEFTKLVKYGAASLFLVLVTHGLVLGFTVATTVLSVVLVAVVCLFEAQLVKTERDQFEKRFMSLTSESEKRIALMISDLEVQVIKVSEQANLDKEQLKELIDNTRSQISAIKMNNGMRKM